MINTMTMSVRRAAVAVVTTAALLLAAVPGAAVANPAKPGQEFQALLDEVVAAGVPGVVGLVRQRGHTWRGAAGLGQIEPAQPMRPYDRVMIGSVTKSFVATVVLQLVGEGRLRLTDTVEQHLPGMVPNGRRITLRHLLNHTSGLYNYTEDPRLAEPYLNGDFGFVWHPDELIALSNDHPPLFEPGGPHSYSNTGYILLGLIIEAVTGTSVGRQLRTRILQPLGLHGTTFPGTELQVKGPHAHGYLVTDGDLLDVTAMSRTWAWSAGGMISTTEDIARFYRALLQGDLLRPKELRAMLTTVPAGDAAGYGLGMWVGDLPCGTMWGHDGGDAGFQTWALQDRAATTQVVMVANAQDDDTIQGLLLQQVDAAFCALADS